MLCTVVDGKVRRGDNGRTESRGSLGFEAIAFGDEAE
jgi:hypothetical protein